MWLASIETSSPVLQVAAVTSDKSGDLHWSRYSSSHTGSHHEEIVQAFERCRSEQNLDWKDLGALILSSGPGSFTGLRIGFGFAKGIAFARGIPLVVISTHEAAVYSALSKRASPRLIAVWSDARRDEFFFSLWSVGEGGIHQKVAPRILSSKDLLEVIAQENSSHQEVYGLPLDESRFAGCPAIESETPDVAAGLIFAASAAQGGIAALLARGAGSFPSMTPAMFAELEPLYVREAAAKKISERNQKPSRA